MDAVKPKSKFARTFHKVINLKSASNNGICILAAQNKVKEELFGDTKKSHLFEDSEVRNRAVMEALAAKLFAAASSIKAAYAEMQMAQNPYNGDAIQAADQAVVHELKVISDLKRAFLKKELHLSPQVTLMLAEIQEQQSLMRTYQITIKKMESDKGLKDSDITLFRSRLDHLVSGNRTLEKKLNCSGSLSAALDNLRLSVLTTAHFVQFLSFAQRSVRSFVKSMVREMESAHWELDAAVKFIEPDARFSDPSHRCFVLESFVSKTMLDGFGDPNFSLSTASMVACQSRRELFFDKFKKLRSVNTRHFLSQNPGSSMARFVRAKYLQLVHAKMECSFFGNLNHRKAVSAGGGFPDSPFFTAFAEMAKRVWLLHCLAFSIDDEVEIFQVKRNCRFSEVYMECATEEADAGGLRVGFTVVPGFKISGTVVQCQVYLSPAR